MRVAVSDGPRGLRLNRDCVLKSSQLLVLLLSSQLTDADAGWACAWIACGLPLSEIVNSSIRTMLQACGWATASSTTTAPGGCATASAARCVIISTQVIHQ